MATFKKVTAEAQLTHPSTPEGPVSATALQTQTFIKSHSKTILLALIVLSALGGAYALFSSLREKKVLRLATDLGDIQKKFESYQEEKDATKRNSLEKSIQEKANTLIQGDTSSIASISARFYLASLYMDKKDFAAAEKNYRDCLAILTEKTPEESNLKRIATYGLASTLETQKKDEEALANYQKLISSQTTGEKYSLYEDNALYAVARMQETKGNQEEAKKLYERLANEKRFTSSGLQTKAKSKLQFY